jgi:hypothetical protein
VNDDRSEQPPNRNCGRGGQPPCPAGTPDFGNDNWWPWIDISDHGDLNAEMKDRRLDTDSVDHEWPASRQRPGNYLVWTWAAQCRVRESSMTPGRACVAPTAVVIPQPTEPVNPGNELFPEQTVFPFRNFQVSDVPSNFDYTFRAGLFAGDYTGNVTGSIDPVTNKNGDDPNADAQYGLWTDARNGRGSGDPTSFEAGRNPICEQSDVFFDRLNGPDKGKAVDPTPWIVTPCPLGATDKNDHGDHH